eukprot:386362-Rhodomonas_salina.4
MGSARCWVGALLGWCSASITSLLSQSPPSNSHSTVRHSASQRPSPIDSAAQPDIKLRWKSERCRQLCWSAGKQTVTRTVGRSQGDDGSDMVTWVAFRNFPDVQKSLLCHADPAMTCSPTSAVLEKLPTLPLLVTAPKSWWADGVTHVVINVEETSGELRDAMKMDL